MPSESPLLCLLKPYLSFICDNGDNVCTYFRGLLGESKEVLMLCSQNGIWPVVSIHYILAFIITLLSRFNLSITTYRNIL